MLDDYYDIDRLPDLRAIIDISMILMMPFSASFRRAALAIFFAFDALRRIIEIIIRRLYAGFH